MDCSDLSCGGTDSAAARVRRLTYEMRQQLRNELVNSLMRHRLIAVVCSPTNV